MHKPKSKPLAFKSAGVFGMTLNKLKAAQAKAATVPPKAPPPLPGDGELSFADTSAGGALAGQFSLEELRQKGRERLQLEDTLFGLAKELLPAGDVNEGIASLRRGDIIKSKLQFQAVLDALAEGQTLDLKREELAQRADIEKQALTAARSRITVDLMGRDIGRAVLFALGAGE